MNFPNRCEIHKFLVFCPCGCPGRKSPDKIIKAADEEDAARRALVIHDTAWSQFGEGLRCQMTPVVIPIGK